MFPRLGQEAIESLLLELGLLTGGSDAGDLITGG